MGQPIVVSSRPGARPEIRFFELNRSLTGMRLETIDDPAEVEGDRWVDELARRLGRLGITRVTIYSSSIVAEAPTWSGNLADEAEDVIRELYIYYVDGKIPEGDYTGEEPPDDGGEAGASSGEEEQASASA